MSDMLGPDEIGEKTDEQREHDAVRQIVRIRSLINRHDLTFEQAAAVLQLALLDDLAGAMRARAPRA